MAKQLIITRHGKSDLAERGTADFDRTLNHRGNKNAAEMAGRLERKQLVADFLLSSPAKRAMTTAQHFARTWQLPVTGIRLEAAIYEASASTLLHLINQLDTQADRVALFGHNPGVTEIVNYLTGAYIANLPTAGIAVIEFPFDDWAMVSQHTGSLVWFDYPKNEESD